MLMQGGKQADVLLQHVTPPQVTRLIQYAKLIVDGKIKLTNPTLEKMKLFHSIIR